MSKLITFTGELLNTLRAKPAGEQPISVERLTEYQVTRDQFVAAYNIANNPITRTRPSIESKNVSKWHLEKSTSRWWMSFGLGRNGGVHGLADGVLVQRSQKNRAGVGADPG